MKLTSRCLGGRISRLYLDAFLAEPLSYPFLSILPHRLPHMYNFPLYSLSTRKDKFIRNSYLGGRTEVLYKQGRVDGDKFYYLDFTSLYPFCASDNELPYGEPQQMDASNWQLHGSKTSDWTSS